MSFHWAPVESRVLRHWSGTAVVTHALMAAIGLLGGYGCGGGDRASSDSTLAAASDSPISATSRGDSTASTIFLDTGINASLTQSADSGSRAGMTASLPTPVLTAAEVTADSGAAVSVAQFTTLRWLEGKWIGLQGSGAPFFERYHWENDSTIMRYTYADQGFVSAVETGWVIFRNGKVYVGSYMDSASMPVTPGSGPVRKRSSRAAVAAVTDAPAWIATRWDPTLLAFSPLKGATNAFVWEKQPDDHWKATMVWRSDSTDHQLAYEMRRSPR